MADKVLAVTIERQLQSSLFKLHIPNALMCRWNEENIKGSDVVRALNSAILNHSVAVKNDLHRYVFFGCSVKTLSDHIRCIQFRVISALEKKSRKVSVTYRTSKGRKKLMVYNGCTTFFVQQTEIVDVKTIANQCKTLSSTCKMQENEIVVYKRQIDCLLQETQRLRYIGTHVHVYLRAQNYCIFLHISYVLDIKAHLPSSRTEVSLLNQGKPIHELSSRQYRRKINTFKTSVERVLWFASSYGLLPVELQCEQRGSSKITSLQLFDGSTSPGHNPPRDEDRKLHQVDV